MSPFVAAKTTCGNISVSICCGGTNVVPLLSICELKTTYLVWFQLTAFCRNFKTKLYTSNPSANIVWWEAFPDRKFNLSMGYSTSQPIDVFLPCIVFMDHPSWVTPHWILGLEEHGGLPTGSAMLWSWFMTATTGAWSAPQEPWPRPLHFTDWLRNRAYSPIGSEIERLAPKSSLLEIDPTPPQAAGARAKVAKARQPSRARDPGGECRRIVADSLPPIPYARLVRSPSCTVQVSGDDK